MNKHNLTALKQQYSDSAKIQSYVIHSYKSGPIGADEVYHSLFFQSPNEQYKVVSILNTDTTAIVQFDVAGYASVYFTRSGYSFRNCSIFTIKNDKITSESTYTERTATDINH